MKMETQNGEREQVEWIMDLGDASARPGRARDGKNKRRAPFRGKTAGATQPSRKNAGRGLYSYLTLKALAARTEDGERGEISNVGGKNDDPRPNVCAGISERRPSVGITPGTDESTERREESGEKSQKGKECGETVPWANELGGKRKTPHPGASGLVNGERRREKNSKNCDGPLTTPPKTQTN